MHNCIRVLPTLYDIRVAAAQPARANCRPSINDLLDRNLVSRVGKSLSRRWAILGELTVQPSFSTQRSTKLISEVLPPWLPLSTYPQIVITPSPLMLGTTIRLESIVVSVRVSGSNMGPSPCLQSAYVVGEHQWAP